jgi:hypothetical protein
MFILKNTISVDAPDPHQISLQTKILTLNGILKSSIKMFQSEITNQDLRLF